MTEEFPRWEIAPPPVRRGVSNLALWTFQARSFFTEGGSPVHCVMLNSIMASTTWMPRTSCPNFSWQPKPSSDTAKCSLWAKSDPRLKTNACQPEVAHLKKMMLCEDPQSPALDKPIRTSHCGGWSRSAHRPVEQSGGYPPGLAATWKCPLLCSLLPVVVA